MRPYLKQLLILVVFLQLLQISFHYQSIESRQEIESQEESSNEKKRIIQPVKTHDSIGKPLEITMINTKIEKPDIKNKPQIKPCRKSMEKILIDTSLSNKTQNSFEKLGEILGVNKDFPICNSSVNNDINSFKELMGVIKHNYNFMESVKELLKIFNLMKNNSNNNQIKLDAILQLLDIIKTGFPDKANDIGNSIGQIIINLGKSINHIVKPVKYLASENDEVEKIMHTYLNRIKDIIVSNIGINKNEVLEIFHLITSNFQSTLSFIPEEIKKEMEEIKSSLENPLTFAKKMLEDLKQQEGKDENNDEAKINFVIEILNTLMGDDLYEDLNIKNFMEEKIKKLNNYGNIIQNQPNRNEKVSQIIKDYLQKIREISKNQPQINIKQKLEILSMFSELNFSHGEIQKDMVEITEKIEDFFPTILSKMPKNSRDIIMDFNNILMGEDGAIGEISPNHREVAQKFFMLVANNKNSNIVSDTINNFIRKRDNKEQYKKKMSCPHKMADWFKDNMTSMDINSCFFIPSKEKEQFIVQFGSYRDILLNLQIPTNGVDLIETEKQLEDLKVYTNKLNMAKSQESPLTFLLIKCLLNVLYSNKGLNSAINQEGIVKVFPKVRRKSEDKSAYLDVETIYSHLKALEQKGPLFNLAFYDEVAKIFFHFIENHNINEKNNNLKENPKNKKRKIGNQLQMKIVQIKEETKNHINNIQKLISQLENNSLSTINEIKDQIEDLYFKSEKIKKMEIFKEKLNAAKLINAKRPIEKQDRNCEIDEFQSKIRQLIISISEKDKAKKFKGQLQLIEKSLYLKGKIDNNHRTNLSHIGEKLIKKIKIIKQYEKEMLVESVKDILNIKFKREVGLKHIKNILNEIKRIYDHSGKRQTNITVIEELLFKLENRMIGISTGPKYIEKYDEREQFLDQHYDQFNKNENYKIKEKTYEGLPQMTKNLQQLYINDEEIQRDIKEINLLFQDQISADIKREKSEVNELLNKIVTNSNVTQSIDQLEKKIENFYLYHEHIIENEEMIEFHTYFHGGNISKNQEIKNMYNHLSLAKKAMLNIQNLQSNKHLPLEEKQQAEIEKLKLEIKTQVSMIVEPCLRKIKENESVLIRECSPKESCDFEEMQEEKYENFEKEIDYSDFFYKFKEEEVRKTGDYFEMLKEGYNLMLNHQTEKKKEEIFVDYLLRDLDHKVSKKVEINKVEDKLQEDNIPSQMDFIEPSVGLIPILMAIALPFPILGIFLIFLDFFVGTDNNPEKGLDLQKFDEGIYMDEHVSSTNNLVDPYMQVLQDLDSESEREELYEKITELKDEKNIDKSREKVRKGIFSVMKDSREPTPVE